jgi:hypothetical protein
MFDSATASAVADTIGSDYRVRLPEGYLVKHVEELTVNDSVVTREVVVEDVAEGRFYKFYATHDFQYDYSEVASWQEITEVFPREVMTVVYDEAPVIVPTDK